MSFSEEDDRECGGEHPGIALDSAVRYANPVIIGTGEYEIKNHKVNTDLIGWKPTESECGIPG